MSHEPKRTNEDFSGSLTILLITAREYGLDTTEPNLLRFLNLRAEVDAEQHATIRHLYNLLHPRLP